MEDAAPPIGPTGTTENTARADNDSRATVAAIIKSMLLKENTDTTESSRLGNCEQTTGPDQRGVVRPEDRNNVPEDRNTVPEDKNTVPEDKNNAPEDKNTVPEDRNNVQDIPEHVFLLNATSPGRKVAAIV